LRHFAARLPSRDFKEYLIYMKHTLVTVAALASCLALNAVAQSNAVSAAAPGASTVPAGPPKIAVISFQEAVAQTNDFQRRFGDLQKKYDPKRQQIKTLSDEIAGLQKELQAQAATMSDADRATKAKLLDTKQKELKRTGDDAQTDFQQDMQQTFGAVAGKFAETLDSYAAEHGFSVVLDNGNQQLPVVIYNNPSVDISKPVIEAYNVKSGIPAPEHPAAAAPGARGTAPARTPAAPKTAPAPH
jgi:outer membrane protein